MRRRSSPFPLARTQAACAASRTPARPNPPRPPSAPPRGRPDRSAERRRPRLDRARPRNRDAPGVHPAATASSRRREGAGVHQPDAAEPRRCPTALGAGKVVHASQRHGSDPYAPTESGLRAVLAHHFIVRANRGGLSIEHQSAPRSEARWAGDRMNEKGTRQRPVKRTRSRAFDRIAHTRRHSACGPPGGCRLYDCWSARLPRTGHLTRMVNRLRELDNELAAAPTAKATLDARERIRDALPAPARP